MNTDQRSRKWGVAVEIGTDRKPREHKKNGTEEELSCLHLVLITGTARRALAGKQRHQGRRMSRAVLSSSSTHWIFCNIIFFWWGHCLLQNNFFFNLVCDFFQLNVFTFCFTPTSLWAAKCLRWEIFNPLHSVTRQEDGMSAVELYCLYHRVREKKADLLISKNLSNWRMKEEAHRHTRKPACFTHGYGAFQLWTGGLKYCKWIVSLPSSI